jgi:hypothetical protein
MLTRTALALVGCLASVAYAGNSIQDVATRAVPGVQWRAKALSGDFGCRGQPQRAILGTSQSEIVVAIFLNGLSAPPEVLRHTTRRHNPKFVALTVENMNFKPSDLEKHLGYLPQGIRPSRSCKGLNLGDGERDSFHIYWNHDNHRFDEWSL